MNAPEIITVVVAVLVGVGGFILNRSGASKNLTDTAMGLYDRVDADNAKLRERIKHLEQTVEELQEEMRVMSEELRAFRRWGDALVVQVEELGGRPWELDHFLTN